MSNYYEVINSIKYLTFKVGDIIEITDKDEIYFDGGKLTDTIASVIKANLDKNFKLVNFKFQVGDYVKILTDKNNILYQVAYINPKEIGLNEVFSKRSKIIHNTKYSLTTFKKVEIYYFYSSKGVIQMAIVGNDKSADEYRKTIGNYFSSSEEASKWILIATKI